MGRPVGPVPGEEASNVEHRPGEARRRQDDDGTASRPEPSGPSTGGVRIIGAETAAEITSELPVVPPAHITTEGTSHASVRIIDEPVGASRDTRGTRARSPTAPRPRRPVRPSCPTGPSRATGQVPAVLARDDGERSGHPAAHLARGGGRLDGPRGGVRAVDVQRRADRTRCARRDPGHRRGASPVGVRPRLGPSRPARPGRASTPASDPITEPVEVVGPPNVAGAGPSARVAGSPEPTGRRRPR